MRYLDDTFIIVSFFIIRILLEISQIKLSCLSVVYLFSFEHHIIDHIFYSFRKPFSLFFVLLLCLIKLTQLLKSQSNIIPDSINLLLFLSQWQPYLNSFSILFLFKVVQPLLINLLFAFSSILLHRFPITL